MATVPGFEVNRPLATTPRAAVSGPGSATERRSLERLRAEVEVAMTEGIVVQRSTGETIWCNPAATKLLRTTRGRMDDTLMGLHHRAIDLNGDPIPAERSPVTTTIRTGLPVRNSVIGIETDEGRRVWLRISSQPGSAGGMPTAITSFNDLSAEVESRRELNDALRQIGGAMLQPTWPHSDRFQFAAASRASSPLGHEFLGAHALSADRCAFYIGTIGADSTQATCAGALVVHTIRSATALLDDPESVMAHIDSTLAAEWPGTSLGLTVGFAAATDDHVRLRLSCRAAPCPVLIDDDTNRSTTDRSAGSSSAEQLSNVTLQPGQRLILGSAGATRESHDSSDLVDALASLDPELPTDELAHAALKHVTDASSDPIDDLSLLVIGAPRRRS